MAITYTTNPAVTAANASAAITSGTLSVAVNDFITVTVVLDDNAAASTWTITNNNTAITWTQHVATNAGNNCKVILFSGIATGTPPTTITFTATAGGDTFCAKAMDTVVHTGQHATTPLPAGNIFSGDSSTDVSQSITPTSSGSALWMIAADWSQTNSFAAGANCTLVSTQNQAGRFSSVFLRPTTQPRPDAAAFTLSETDTGGAIAWIAYEVQAAAGASDQTLVGSLYTNTTTFFTGTILGGSTHVFQSNVFQNNVFQMEAAGAFNASFSESAATGDSQTATVSASAARTETAATGDSQTASALNGAVMVQWEPSADPNVTGYFVYWDTVSHAGGVYTDYAFSADVAGNAAAQYLITNLVVGQNYFINISSHGPGGHDANESDLWGEVSDVASDLGLWQFLNGGLRYENPTTFFTGSIVQGGIGAFADTAATGDSQTAAISASVARTETAATGDIQSAALSSTVASTETASTADSQNAANSASATAAETAATGDSQTSVLSATASSTETSATGDTGTASLGGGLFTVGGIETAAHGDSQSAGLTASVSATETAATADTGTANLGGGLFNATGAETAATGDSQTPALSATASASETSATADTGVASLGGGLFTASFTESAGSVDSQTAGLTATASAGETAATSDSNTGLNGLGVSRTESVLISDIASGGVSATVSFGESLSIIDSPIATMAAIVSASDIVMSSDSSAGVNSKLAQFAESAATGDSIGSSLSTQIIPTLDWSRYHIKVKAKTRRIRIHL